MNTKPMKFAAVDEKAAAFAEGERDVRTYSIYRPGCKVEWFTYCEPCWNKSVRKGRDEPTIIVASPGTRCDRCKGES